MLCRFREVVREELHGAGIGHLLAQVEVHHAHRAHRVGYGLPRRHHHHDQILSFIIFIIILVLSLLTGSCRDTFLQFETSAVSCLTFCRPPELR